MPYPGRNKIYETTIKRMISQSLEAQEQEFALEHGSDSDDELLAYLSSCASVLKHTPWPREIVGGGLIEQRFGTWRNAVLKARLPMPTTPDELSGFARYQEETQRQKALYREKNVAKKLRAQQRLKAQKMGKR